MLPTWLSDPTLLLAGVVLVTVQFIAALPWLWAIDEKGFKEAAVSPASLGYVVVGLLVAGAGFAAFLAYKGDATNLTWYGRYLYGAILQHKLIAAICHGPAALLSARRPPAPWSFDGYRMAPFTNAE